jgi:hypothetical protein
VEELREKRGGKKVPRLSDKNIKDGPAPQYDLCGQRGPVKREMSLCDRGGGERLHLVFPEVIGFEALQPFF